MLHCMVLASHSHTACLQSNQLRQLTQASLDSYVAFFEQYREAGKSIHKVWSCRLPPVADNSYNSRLHTAGARRLLQKKKNSKNILIIMIMLTLMMLSAWSDVYFWANPRCRTCFATETTGSRALPDQDIPKCYWLSSDKCLATWSPLHFSLRTG